MTEYNHCQRCNVEMPLYRKNMHNKQVVSRKKFCAKCLHEKYKIVAEQYRLSHKDKVNANQRRKYKLDPDRYKKYVKKYVNKNTQKVRQYQRDYYSIPENREKRRKYKREYMLRKINEEKQQLNTIDKK
jgi:predicted solute-binding protein